MGSILVVDDSSVIRRTVKLTLERRGFEVLAVESGDRALETLGEGGIDLAIVDVAMPGMDGLELVRRLRGNSDTAALPVIMLTMSGQDADRADAIRAGVDTFLTKPTSSWELLSAVERHLA